MDYNEANRRKINRRMKEQLSNDLKGNVSEEESRFWIRQIREYKDPWGYIAEVQGWLNFSGWKKISTLEEFREKITKDNGFEPRHIKKIEAVISLLKDEGIKYVPK